MTTYLLAFKSPFSTRIVMTTARDPQTAKDRAAYKTGRAGPWACTPLDSIEDAFTVEIGLDDIDGRRDLAELIAKAPS